MLNAAKSALTQSIFCSSGPGHYRDIFDGLLCCNKCQEFLVCVIANRKKASDIVM